MENKKDAAYFRKFVREPENWAFWRLIMEGVITFTEASEMSSDEIMEANAALDYFIEIIDEQSKKNN